MVAVHEGHVLVHEDEAVDVSLLCGIHHLCQCLLAVVALVSNLVNYFFVDPQSLRRKAEKHHKSVYVKWFVVHN